MRIGSLELQVDVSPTAWILDRIHPFATDVGSVIPDVFEAYARVLHPAHRYAEGGRVAVTWAEIAAANGRIFHPEMQWPHIAGAWEHSGVTAPGLWDGEPEVGTLPRDHAGTLAKLLARHTATPHVVWFCVWEGWGGLLLRGRGDGEPPDRRKSRQEPAAPLLELPGRRYHLLRGPIESIAESLCVAPSWQSANLWWPDDRAWCVATEIDFAWTYIGGAAGLIEALTRHPLLEVVPCRIDHGLTYASDRLNPAPPGGPGS